MDARTYQAARVLYEHMCLRTRPMSQLAGCAVLVVPSRARHTSAYARAAKQLADELRPKRILIVGGETSLIRPVFGGDANGNRESKMPPQLLTLPQDTPGVTATNVADVAQLCRLHGVTAKHFVVTQSGTAMRRVLRTFQTLWPQCASEAGLAEDVQFESAPVDIFQPRTDAIVDEDELLFLRELCEEVEFLVSFSAVGVLAIEDGDLDDRVLQAAADLKAYLACRRNA